MKLEDLKEKLEMIAPTAYRAFAKGTRMQPPFICYFVDDEKHSGADNKNYIRERHLVTELYTEGKNEEIEEKLDRLFDGYEFEKYETRIEDEALLQVAYHLTITEKI